MDANLKKRKHWVKTFSSFFLVLFTMPLGHALMRIMESTMSETAVNIAAFVMGLCGISLVIYGVFLKNNTLKTLAGLFGGLLFWTGWVEFLFGYYAHRFGVHYDLTGSGTISSISEYVNGIMTNSDMFINGESIKNMTHEQIKSFTGSRPEYLIMPSSFGFWVMFMLIYIFNSRTGCHAYNWIQKMAFGNKTHKIVPHSMTRHISITTFMELNMMLWTLYLVLMFCYDPVLLGAKHPVTIVLGLLCLIGSGFMFRHQLKLSGWDTNIRMSIATVIIFWTAVEIAGRNKLFSEIWIYPQKHLKEMAIILGTFLAVSVYVFFKSLKKNKTTSI